MPVVEPLSLAAEFAPADRGAWLAEVERATSGRSIEDLTTALGELAVLPLYTRADRDERADPVGFPGITPFVRGGSADGGRGWDLRQLHALGDADIAASVVSDLEQGATSLLIDVGASDVTLLAPALAGVHLDLAPVVLRPGGRFAEAAAAMIAVWAARDIAANARVGGLGIDPIGAVGQGRLASDGLPALVAEAASIAATSCRDSPGVTAIAVDVTGWVDAGAGEVSELAYAVATGVAYLRALADAGLGLTRSFDQLEFTYAATADQFVTMAKLRAARRLWARVADSCSVTEPRPQRQHALTSVAGTGSDDPWADLVRTTVAAFSAGVGGADAVTCRPLTPGPGLTDGLARRLARNTQLLLLEESNLGRVIDPGGGSWYLEDLTDQLARAAWAEFRQIESDGGMVSSVASGTIAAPHASEVGS